MVARWIEKLFRAQSSAVVPGLMALIIIVLLQFIGVPQLDGFGLSLFDSYQRAAPRPYEDAPVRIVDIDNDTIRKFGQWPWPRTDLASLTKRLGDAGATVIAYDIVFSEADRTSPARIARSLARTSSDERALSALRALPDNDAVFASQLAESPTVLGYFLTREGKRAADPPKAGIVVLGSAPNAGLPSFTNAIEPLPALRASATGSGFVSLVGDADGIIRKAPLLADQNGQILPSLALDALRAAQGAGSIAVKSSNASGEVGGDGGDVVSIKVGQFEVPTTHAGELWMYFTAPNPDRVVPAWQIMSGALSQAQMEQIFGGRIVFVGTGAAGLRDLVATPIADRELGVMVHAQAVEQMILGQFLSRPDWAEGLERSVMIVFGILLAVLLPRLGATMGAGLGAVMVGVLGFGSWRAFADQHFLINPTYPVLAIIAVYLVETAVTYYREERRRAYIHQAFDRYLSPTLVKRIVNDPGQLELGGEEREMTVLFCDIRSFSRISEALSPQDIIRFLIGFLTPMCDILLDRKATIDKFIGDAILAFWNAPLDDPDQYRNAAHGALAMVARLETLNQTMPNQTETPWPGEVNIGIGLNAGPCCVGNMGSAQRLSYSLIGDTVNLASRIEGLTKYYGVRILIGSALEAQLEGFAMLPLDTVRVVGREAPETIHVLIGDEMVATRPDFRSFRTSHQAFITAYREQDWPAARRALAVLDVRAGHYGLVRYYALMADRITAFEANPPGSDWNGIYNAVEK
ncbi:MAG: adenylate/guanylate cyclase domain-containing protein [Sphingomonas sp.]|nr:adenylate/guanylate cyclase domain-containing protein [Sphingomonas sp.]